MSLKESMPGFFIENEPTELTNVVVAIDTNFLFSLLTVNQKTFEELYKVLEKLNSKNQLFIPNHVAKEYILDAEDTCRKDGVIYSNVNKKVDAFLSNYEQIKNDYKDRVSDFKLIQDKIDSFNKELKEFISKQLNKPDYKKRRESIEKLFNNIGKPYSRKQLYKLQKELEFRFSAFIPPGFMDNTKKNGNKYGDGIIWFQLMDYAKKENKDIIYVTIDVKDDWQINNQFRKELYNEFYLETEKKLFIYNPDELIQIYNKLTKVKESTSKDVKSETTKSYTELLIDSLPKNNWGSYEIPLVSSPIDSTNWLLLDDSRNFNDKYFYDDFLTTNYDLYNSAGLLNNQKKLKRIRDALDMKINALNIMNNLYDLGSNNISESKITIEKKSEEEKKKSDITKEEETDKKAKKEDSEKKE